MSKKSKPRPSRRGGVPRERTSTDASSTPTRKPRRRRPLIAVILVLTATAAAIVTWRGSRGTAPAFPPAGAAKGFNLLIVTLDTTRADRMGYHGHAAAATPTLDRLAREGIACMNAVSPVPLTLPAHSSLFTGLDPQHHAVRNNGEYRLDDAHVTLAEIFKGQGYDTAAFVSAFVLDARFGVAQGFDTYDDRMERLSSGAFGGMDSERLAGPTTDAATAWLEGRSGKRPFFVWVHYFDPHDKYEPPPSYAARCPGQPYDGEIAYMDAELGRLLQQVERRAQDRRTLVVVAGDHGESLGDHGTFGHGNSLYEPTQHVPFILWGPPLVPGGGRVHDVVSLVDVFPTVLDLLGIAHESALDGVSLRHAHERPQRAVYMETMATYLDNGWAPLHGLRRAADKYIFAPKPEYYDLAVDPGEQQNLAGAREPTVESAVRKLTVELAERMQDSPSAEAVAAAAVALDPDARRRLETLGYLGGGDAPAPVHGSPGGELPNPRDMLPIHALYLEGKRLAQSGQIEAGVAKVKEAVQHSPNNRAMLQTLAGMYLRMDRPADAEPILRRCIELQPTGDALMLLGQILIHTQRYAEAQQALEEARRLSPEHGGVLIAQGDLSLVFGRAAEAQALYEEAIRVDPYRAAGAAKARLENLQRQLAAP